MLAAPHLHRAALLLAGALFLSCSDTPTENEQPQTPASLDIVAGDEQSGVVGTELANPLVVRVEDANGQPVAGQLVNFRVTAGGGSVFAEAGLTNAQGIVQDRWTLGTSTAESQRVEARAVDPNTGAPIVFATFKATPLPGPAHSVTKAGGDTQTGGLGAPLGDSLAVRVADSFGNPVPGVPVTWATTAGNGGVSPASSTTSALGIAKTRWTLGPRLDMPHQVTAQVAALAAAQFTATATLPGSARIVPVVGQGTTATVATALADSIAVRVELEGGQAVPGATVIWAVASGGGSISPATSTTLADGVTRARFTLGTGVGAHAVSASVPGLTPATVTVTGTPDVPATLTKTAGDGQTGLVAEPLPQPVTVRVADRHGNAVPNVSVTWAPSLGTVAPTAATTDASGQAAVTWTLGQASGTHTLSASVSGLAPAQFAATARAGSVASIVVTAGAGQSATAGSALASLIEVHATDRFGNSATDATITFAASDGGSFAPASATTDAAGRAASRWTLGGTAGTQTATMSSGSVSATATATATTGSAALITIVSGNAQPGIAGDPLANPLVVRVTDANSNPVAGATVTWTVGSSCGSVSATSTATDASGMAQVTWTLATSGRLCTAGVMATTAGGSSVQFTARFLGRTAQMVDPGNFVEQVGTIDVPVVLTATVTDNGENPVPNVTVNWSRTQGNGVLATSSSVTDSLGRASATLTPGTLAGDNRVSATVNGVIPVEYLVWTRALAPERIVIVDGNNQTGEPGQPLSQPIRVRVEDTYGNGVYNQPVTFQVTTGGGHVERTTLHSDPSGVVGTIWVPGSVGGQTVRATWSSSSVMFSATGIEGVREGLIIVGGNEQVAVTSQQREHFLSSITVRVVNGRGEPVSGVPVTFASSDGSQTVTSDASGLATGTNLRVYLLGIGPKTVTATLPNGTVARFTLIVQSGGGGGFGVPSHTGPATARAGRRLPGRIAVECSDRMGGVSSCSLNVQGEIIPAPGIFAPGRTEYFWILPTQPGTYSFTVFGSAGPNQITATATP